jgi:hypothetical protein
MTPIERYRAGLPVKWSDFKTFEERARLFRQIDHDTGYHIDFEYVGWVDYMNINYYPDGTFERYKP